LYFLASFLIFDGILDRFVDLRLVTLPNEELDILTSTSRVSISSFLIFFGMNVRPGGNIISKRYV